MTIVEQNTKGSISDGLRLILPAFQFSFSAIGRLWPLFLAGVVITLVGLIPMDFVNGIEVERNGLLKALGVGIFFTGYIAANVMLLARAWTACANLLSDKLQERIWSFGTKERAASVSILGVYLTAIFVSAIPITIVWIITRVSGVVFGNAETLVLFSAPGLGYALIFEAVCLRYWLAVPQAIATAPKDRDGVHPIGRAWQRVQPIYAKTLLPILSILAISHGTSHLLSWSTGELGVLASAAKASAGIFGSISFGDIGSSLSNYVISAISTGASIFVIYQAWKETRPAFE